MEAKENFPELPDHSFLLDRQFFRFDNLYYSVCLLTFVYYNANGKLCYIYHVLLDNVFVRAFTSYNAVNNYFSKLT